MSLWTPDGEIPIERRSRGQEPPAPSPAVPGAAGLAGAEGIDLDKLTPEQRQQLEEAMAQMAAVQEQIANTPAAQVLANHLMGFYELAAIKLSTDPPQVGDAKLAIDAMEATLDLIGGQLGEDGTTLRGALSNLQMAYVEVTTGGQG